MLLPGPARVHAHRHTNGDNNAPRRLRMVVGEVQWYVVAGMGMLTRVGRRGYMPVV